MEGACWGKNEQSTEASLTPLSGLISGLVQTQSGGRLNKKDGLTSYGDSHVKDKTS